MPPSTKNQRERDDLAPVIASSYEVVNYKGVLYIPADFETLERHVTPAPERKVWLPFTHKMIRMTARHHDLSFRDDRELSSFRYQMEAEAIDVTQEVSELLIRTDEGLRMLTNEGSLVPATGQFVPNYLPIKMNTDPELKEQVMELLIEWVDDDEEAMSLLHHLATTLAPHWSAVKYVLLIGEGRNGKSLLMEMIERIFGEENCSHVTRQQISESNPVVTEVMGKLVNIVKDGPASYLKDSGNEKSLIAGEEIPIRRLYQNQPTMVSTNGLFIEGLNREPKSRDKSSALQSRLARFEFPNVYLEDRMFYRWATSPEVTGALLSLMVDNYVREHEIQIMLAPTARSIELKLDHMISNSAELQFLMWLEDNGGPDGADELIGKDMRVIVQKFKSWRVMLGDIGVYADDDVARNLRTVVQVGPRRSTRQNNKVVKVRTVEGFKPDAARVLAHHRTVEVMDDDNTVVDE